jgi:hypothetical protein
VVLPRYAELQRGETAHVADHLAHQVPDLRLATLPSRYEALVTSELPLAPTEVARLRRFSDKFADLCQGLADQISDTVQHDDLHAWNVYRRDGQWRVLDWGDASISHPFVSLVVTFRFLEETNGLPPTDPWFTRLRDAYLEPWGHGLADMVALALRVGAFAHPLVELRHRTALGRQGHPRLDESMRIWLQRALADAVR